tara:strand:- start:5409 stop:7061 length:1653 start_codon:yes stop_codon:yes gene_type:complete
MKIILTESQLELLLEQDRHAYLTSQNVINPELLEPIVIPDDADEQQKKKLERKARKQEAIEVIQGNDNVDIAYIVPGKGDKVQVKLAPQTLESFFESDPTRSKEYVQWLIEVLVRMVKAKDIDSAIRFLTEDLLDATDTLALFDSIKGTGAFKRGAANRPDAPKNPKDIRLYRDVNHLDSVIAPFRDSGEEGEEGEVHPVFAKLKKFVDLGQAEIVYRDESVMVYMPKHIDASCEPLPNPEKVRWCTNRPSNSMFNSYRTGTSYLKPDGNPSDYYVIIPKKYFDGDDEDRLYPIQMHFESNQLMDSKDGRLGDRLNTVLGSFPGMTEFFRSELGGLAAEGIRSGSGLMENHYIKYLNEFGGKVEDYVPKEAYAEGVLNIKKLAKEQRGPVNDNKYLKWLLSNEDDVDIIEYIPLDIQVLNFSDINLGTLPDLSMFTEADQVVAGKCNLTQMPAGNQLPPNMTILTLPNNQLTNATFEGYGENLEFLMVVNLYNNPIQTVDVDSLENLLNKETLARFAITNPAELTNYDEYSQMIEQFEESHPNHGVYLDV